MRSFGQQQVTQAEALAQLATFLASCPDGRLQALTVDEVARRYRLPLKTVEYHLTIAKQKRVEFLATGAIG